MKKIILFFAIAIASTIAVAQKMQYGIKGGLNLSHVSPGSGLEAGFHLGGFLSYKLNDKFGIQPELLYSLENGLNEYNGTSFESQRPYNYSSKVSLNTLALPVVFKYYISDKFNLELGPQINFLLSSTLKFKIVEQTDGTYATCDTSLNSDVATLQIVDPNGSKGTQKIRNDFKSNATTFSFNIGGSYKLNAKMFLQARYSLGLTNFSGNSNLLAGNTNSSGKPIDESRVNEAQKISNFQLSFGYIF